jgi:hypothetical protein
VTYGFTQLIHYLDYSRHYRYRYLDGWQEKDIRAQRCFWAAFEQALGAYFLPEDPEAAFYREWPFHPRRSSSRGRFQKDPTSLRTSKPLVWASDARPQLLCYSWITGISKVPQVVVVRKHLVEIQYLRTTIVNTQREEFGNLVKGTVRRNRISPVPSAQRSPVSQNHCTTCPYVGLCLGQQKLIDTPLVRRPETILIYLTNLRSNNLRETCTTTPGRISGPKSQLTPAFYRFQAIRGADLAQHPANMVLNCLLREIERSSNFLVREAFAEQLH